MLNYDSVLDELKAAYKQNKELKARIAELEKELDETRKQINLIYDAQNG